MTSSAPAISLVDIRKQYGSVEAVRGVSIDIRDGEFLALIGPSGCGKTSTLRMIAGLETPTSGEILFYGSPVTHAKPWERDTPLVWQGFALFPHLTVARNVEFGLRMHKVAKGERQQRVAGALRTVGLEEYANRLPAQLSGGQKQRVGIARAFAGEPKVVIADEPVSALDVSVQAAVTQLLMEIQHRNRTTLLFISHDLSLVRYLADRVVVMYLGQIMEQGSTDEVFAPPYHPYTEALLSAVPIADTRIRKKHIVLEGEIPSALNLPSGCPFHTRCHRKIGRICETEAPPVRQFGSGHQILCHLPPEELLAMEPVIAISDEPRQAAAE